MTYKEAVDYIFWIFRNLRKRMMLQHTKTLSATVWEILRRRSKVIHVAGTNGKGSVCAYLDGMLRSEGKRTGLFTSPHLVKINERIVIDGVPISDDAFVCVFEKILPV